MPISWGPTLMVDLALLLRRVAIADDPDLRNRALELAQLLGREPHVRSSQVLVQMGQLGRGMATIQGFLAITHAKATCADVAPRVRPNVLSTSTIARLALIASGSKRGRVLRLSFPESNRVYSLTAPPRKPLLSGLYGTKPIPSSSSTGKTS